MKAAQLETMANAILEGKLSVAGAEQMLGGKVVHTPTLGNAEASAAHKAHAAMTRRDAAMHYRMRKHAVRVNPTGAADDERVERFGGQRLWPDQRFESSFLNFLPKIAEDALREQSPKTAGEQEAATRDRWNVAEVARLRWPVVAFRPTYNDPSGTRKPLLGDDANGYIKDETWTEGQARLDAELRLPHARPTRDWQRDDEGYIVLDENGSRTEQVEEQIVMGATQWEYRRRSQGREPWMSRKTFIWLQGLKRDAEQAPWMLPGRTTMAQLAAAERKLDREYRAAQRNKRNRAQLIQLIRDLGGDPKAPKVVAWVKSNGIAACLRKLEQRAKQEA